MAKTPREFYSETGVKWLSHIKTEEQTGKELACLVRLLKKNGEILDLACGYGRFSIELASLGYKVHGLDITPVFVEKAQEEARKRNLDIDFRIGDMTDIPYGEQFFDSVICMWNAFSELSAEEEQRKALLEMYRVLKDGGMAIIEMRNHRSAGLIEENTIDGLEAMPSYNHTRGSMKKLLELTGIKSYSVFIDNFGGRNRLLVEIRKTQKA
jgi:ubiquinone/menaquinone biosynthesis C-methylase UbiE